MKEKTKIELKKIVKEVLLNKYGFSPKLKDVKLLEARGDGTYILFEIGFHEYCFNSYLINDNVIYLGIDTLEQRS